MHAEHFASFWLHILYNLFCLGMILRNENSVYNLAEFVFELVFSETADFVMTCQMYLLWNHCFMSDDLLVSSFCEKFHC